MSTVLIAIVAMTVLGVLFGLFLALASRAFRVQQDPRIEAVLEALPGINCGACGYAGCRSYAQAVVEGEKVGLCTAIGPDAGAVIAAIMGVEFSQQGRSRAVVHCQGGTDRCADRSRYDGIQDCRAAHIISGGPKACAYGCLGFGTCADVCPFNAITMSDQRLPVIDADKCTACGMCVRVCPRDLISLLDEKYTIYLGCSSHYRGKAVKDICEVGCTACNLCAKKDPNGAIELQDNLPVLDFEKSGGGFSVAAQVCPMNCFVVESRERALEAAAPAADAR